MCGCCVSCAFTVYFSHGLFLAADTHLNRFLLMVCSVNPLGSRLLYPLVVLTHLFCSDFIHLKSSRVLPESSPVSAKGLDFYNNFIHWKGSWVSSLLSAEGFDFCRVCPNNLKGSWVSCPVSAEGLNFCREFIHLKGSWVSSGISSFFKQRCKG